MNKLSIGAIIVCCLWLFGSRSKADQDGDGQFFQTKIAPLLQERCLTCHSHEAKTMEGGLALDSRSGWAVGGESGPAVVPGKPHDSLLIKAVRRGDSSLQMPPDEKLSDHEIELLVRWVRSGAADPRRLKAPPADDDWWSLRPLARPQLPTDQQAEHPIDAFVRARLHQAGVTPQRRADRRTLIRRLYFDLHGLIPTPAQVREFVSDPDPLAYRKLVDRLLQSPRYGERWGRHWLDVVHFADTHGCEHDYKRDNAWRYRDYVIRRLNDDVAWDRFIREQLAADELFPDQPELTPALGFIAAGPLELSRAGTAPVTFDYLDRDDMVTQTMAAFASTTANCARCHTHKFDPITQEDYYALQAVFAGVGKGDVRYDISHEVALERARLEKMIADASAKDQRLLNDPSLKHVAQTWSQHNSELDSLWIPLDAETFLSNDGATVAQLSDESFLVSGHLPDRDTYTVTGPYRQKQLTAIRLDVLADAGLPAKGPGRAANGNFHLTEMEARIFHAGSDKPLQLTFHKATADWNQEGWPVDHALDGNLMSSWGIYPKVGTSHHAVFELEQPLEIPAGSRLAISIRQLHGGKHVIGRFRLSVTAADPSKARLFPADVTRALQIPAGKRTEHQQREIDAYAIGRHLEQQLAALPDKGSVYAVSPLWLRGKKLEQPQPPKVVHLLRRGAIGQPIREVGPGALSAIEGLPSRFAIDDGTEAKRRAALAGWLASRDNPLTWRSVVNRVWHYHFGRGICDTTNDFGRMGDQPSHPELLDWLAVWFRDDARGSLKQLHRLILTSQTWQRAVLANEEARSIDAENRLLWRGNRRRLDAETFRDCLLQLSGRLDLKMGGPGIEQFKAGKGIQNTPFLDYSGFDWNSVAGARRSVYRVVWRGIPDPFMEAMDFPDLGLLNAKREFSVSALQSLALFNDDLVLHVSRWTAQRLQRQAATVEGQVRCAAALVLLREPSSSELKEMIGFVNSHSLAALCRVLLNSNEFLFVD